MYMFYSVGCLVLLMSAGHVWGHMGQSTHSAPYHLGLEVREEFYYY